MVISITSSCSATQDGAREKSIAVLALAIDPNKILKSGMTATKTTSASAAELFVTTSKSAAAMSASAQMILLIIMRRDLGLMSRGRALAATANLGHGGDWDFLHDTLKDVFCRDGLDARLGLEHETMSANRVEHLAHVLR